MLSRFVQLFLLASMILLIPSLLYLSHGPSNTYLDPKTGLAYSSDSIRPDVNPLSNSNPLAQTSQGDGVDAQQAHKWSGWTWSGVNSDVIKKPVEKFEGTWKGWMDAWKSSGRETSPLVQSSTTDGSGAAKAAVAGSADDAKVKSPSKQTEERIDGIIMPKMGNATAKAALGRSTWHFLHTMTLRFPDKPTKEQRKTLQTFFENFALLYPCGDCARHFQALIKELPPQTGSRMNSALWLCTVHNKVNERLGKPEFPCDKLDESYDCGCGDDPKASAGGTAPAATSTAPAAAKSTPSLRPFNLAQKQRLEDGVRALGRRALEFGSVGSMDEGAQHLARRMTDECLCRVR
ncbi:uncharacterized protein PFL1_00082 [Pseudozyma flocculosa PF-1]|uniref:Sulfhydryl oxidase n=1 Tax=Pseudozyma flocculosa TaxID=84751 RepID=A0A5C3EVM2_9BASI|nr:uncharacterized protein PFL1_00082 [Pseudozyma flocculosa PF-1]EPQ31883.1 hypothetical protein PFL1_00082 [Pseudozyma flocculosa PF-1]SPO35209.1 related to ERV2 - Flavin dependent sulfhydryl oxidase [Pseudozyma flocculosa]